MTTMGQSGSGLHEALHEQEQMMPGFARWMYRTVRGELGGVVLDAGAGIGTFTDILVNDGRTVIALEADERFRQRIAARFAGNGRVTVLQADLADAASFAHIPPVDSVLCLNVLEHIEDDLAAMRNLLAVTRPGGNMVALVPAYPFLFNRMDVAVGHYRRYGKKDFTGRLIQAGWHVERTFRFNAFGIPGWFMGGSVLRRQTPGRTLYRLFDALVPVFSFLERTVVRGAVGLSIVAICRRPE